MISFNGPLFFGTSHRIYDAIDTIEPIKVLIVDLTNVYFLDTTASYILKELFERFGKKSEIILSINNSKEKELLEKLGLKSKLKSANIVKSNKEAIRKAESILVDFS